MTIRGNPARGDEALAERREEDADSFPALRAVEISKTYGRGEGAIHALRKCSLELHPGTLTVVMGPSGSGKSTLMHLLAGLDALTTGRVWMAGVALSDLSESKRARWRARYIGFVLQKDNLIPSLTLEENVATPIMLAGIGRGSAIRQARETLDAVGLTHRAQAWPGEVSGGEAQRAAVARACSGSPRLIFADEPTGALDSVSGQVVLGLLASLSRTSGAATLMVTHDVEAAAIADRIVRIEDGRLREA